METTVIFILVSIFTCFYIFITQSGYRKSGPTARLPPGPYRFPIIGSIFKLGNKPHHSLAALSKIYGPLMSLKLGSTTMIVVNSREIVQEFFFKNDVSFSSRSIPYTAHSHDRHTNSMVWLPVGDKWRSLRKISKEQLFSVRQLDASQYLRKKKVQELLDYVQDCSVNGKAINIGQIAASTTLNVLSNYIFSFNLAQYDSNSNEHFKDLVWTLMELGGAPNLADFFPFLRMFDPHGMHRRASDVTGKLLAVFDQHIKKRLEARAMKSSDAPLSTNDLMDMLLDISQEEKSSINLVDTRILIFDLFLAGTDTTSSTLEWAMAELIRNPEIMSKARSELLEIMGNEDGPIEESEISRLPYLQAVVKETLRLHPPGTFLVPHRAMTDVEVNGYLVPKDAHIICNLWAMGQDSTVWPNPQMFEPERFLDVKIDYKGQNFEYIPFGTGRRMCPGLPLVQRMLPATLGSLIHKFDWKLEGGIKPQDMDMTDKFGFTLQKNLPLLAIPIKL